MILGIWSVTLEVPHLEAGVRFYEDAGLTTIVNGNSASFTCPGQTHESIVLLGGAPFKKLHHLALRAIDLEAVAHRVDAAAGQILAPPKGFPNEGLWIRDPLGSIFHLVERPADAEPSAVDVFEINAPGRVNRIRRSAILPGRSYSRIVPRRLGHVLLFTPDVMKSAAFMTDALGMGLADYAQDVIAFCCARKDSEHHVVAFAKSPGIGFHHASFQVSDPDEVGRGGRALLETSKRGDWGFGRHTIGSNFFHYIQDPWGSWFEYYSDMDFIDDYRLWTPTNYALEDSLASWAPALPKDFVHNYEFTGGGFVSS